MDNNEALNQALMGINNPSETGAASPRMDALRNHVKNLSKAALVGLILTGCAAEGTRDTQVGEETRYVSAMWTGQSYKDAMVYGVYPDDITVNLTEIGNPDNSVTIQLNVKDQEDGNTAVYVSFPIPVRNDVDLKVFNKTGTEEFPNCLNDQDNENCFSGPYIIPGP